MSRHVVSGTTPRCDRCRLPPRWCVCAGLRMAACALEIDVLMHHREQWRPSSTGHLIKRTLPAARTHIWRRERGLTADDVRVPGRELWLLHPRGEPMPEGAVAGNVQAVLIDGSWREAGAMSQEMSGWGRLVNLPMAGESRYWLRSQAEGGRFSTAEALIFLLGALGLNEAQAALRLQLELHVYAGLRSRGAKEAAEKFLAESPLRTELPELIEQLNVRRPREDQASAGRWTGGEKAEAPE